jgi:hypothetical protein
MSWKFRKHYTRDTARAMLPRVRLWLTELRELRRKLERYENRAGQLLTGGRDVGGPTVNAWVKAAIEMQGVLAEFERREIQIKDVDRGLLDFPAVMGGREVFLCWEQDEDDIEYWHDLDTGYAGRERL